MAANLGKLCLRKISTSIVLKESLAKPLNENVGLASSHASDYKFWRKLFFYICCPAMALGYINVLLEEEKKPPEFKKYPHLRIRKKPFPWRDGQKTLFHNPHKNALPDGYENV